MALNKRSYVWALRGLDPEIKISSLDEQVLKNTSALLLSYWTLYFNMYG